MKSWLLPAAALIAGAVTVSCAAILGFERLSEEGTPDAISEAGPPDVIEGGGSPPDAAKTACNSIDIPDPPTNVAAGNAPALLGAFRILDFGIEVDGGRPTIPGFNLDQTCSVDVATSSCRTKLLPVAFEQHAKDKSATGIDNAGFSLIEFISRFSDVLNAQALNDGIAAGTYGAVIRVDKWNGLEDDDDVSVEVFPAIGFKTLLDGGKRPNFNDNDEWILDERYKVGGVLEASSVKSDRAYITKGRLVARFQFVSLRLALVDDPKPFEIRLTDALFTATVHPPTDAGFATDRVFTDGVIAGRWKTSDFLGEVRTIFVKEGSGLENTTLCEPDASVIYGAVKSQICDGRDIRSDSQDNKALPCDALSAAARVEAYRIKNLGSFGLPPDGGGRCTKPNVVPVGDDCAPN